MTLYTAAFGFGRPNDPCGPAACNLSAHTDLTTPQPSISTDSTVLMAFCLYGPNCTPAFSFGRLSSSCDTHCSLAHGLYGPRCTTLSGFGKTHGPRAIRPIWSWVFVSLQPVRPSLHRSYRLRPTLWPMWPLLVVSLQPIQSRPGRQTLASPDLRDLASTAACRRSGSTAPRSM